MKFSDFVAKKLESAGIDFVSGVTGGGVVHLLHSMENLKGVRVIYTHHEQAAAYAAEGYTRMSKRAACFVTTGPGGTNAITGLASAWLDSIPVVFISGQARSKSLTSPGTVRQIGSQHFDIISVVQSITKYARTISRIEDAEEILNKALSVAFSDRPGPVWIDIPLDFQEMDFEPKIDINAPYKSINTLATSSKAPKIEELELMFSSMEEARRPLIIMGYGARISGTHNSIIGSASKAGVPMVFTWNTLDMLESNHELNLGLVGVNGMRSANLAVAASDFVIAIGSHLSLQLTGPDVNNFAPNAQIFVIDIDSLEIKNLNKRFNGVCADLSVICESLLFNIESLKVSKSWKDKISEIKTYRNYGLNLDPDLKLDRVNQYYFYKEISKKILPGDSIVIDGGGNVLFSSHQQLEINSGVRLVTGHGLGCMGSALPHAVGVSAIKNNLGRTYCFIGDGSMQFNIQELATINYHQLPITIFIINNDGYLAIMNTQDTFFDRRFGVDKDSGLCFPDYSKIAESYEIPYLAVRQDSELQNIITMASTMRGPCIVEIFVEKNTPLLPKVGYKISSDGNRTRSAIYDMDPLLDDVTIKKLIDL